MRRKNNQWIIEAINAQTQNDNRIMEQLTVVDTFDNDNNGALRKYVELRKAYPEFHSYHSP